MRPRGRGGSGYVAGMRRKIRSWMWRYRLVLAAALIGIAVLAAINEFRPPPGGEPVLVAVRELPAGEPISAGDVEERVLPLRLSDAAEQPVGATPVITIPAGLPIATSMLLGPHLADAPPPGTVLAPVRIADPAMLDLLRVGDLVDLYLANSDVGNGDLGSTMVAAGVRVVAFPSGAGAGPSLLGPPMENQPATFLGAIRLADANVFAGASALAPFRVVIAPA